MGYDPSPQEGEMRMEMEVDTRRVCMCRRTPPLELSVVVGTAS